MRLRIGGPYEDRLPRAHGSYPSAISRQFPTGRVVRARFPTAWPRPLSHRAERPRARGTGRARS
jgi:hypothetical protein